MLKKGVRVLLTLLGLCTAATFFIESLALAKDLEKMIGNIQWNGHQASVRITSGKKILYIDPYTISENAHDADIILITHSHQDHLSPGDIAKLVKKETVFVAPGDCAPKIEAKFKTKVLVSKPGMTHTIGDLQIEAVPAYNVVKTKYHPSKNNWVGYIVTVDGVRIYHAGDTERIPEMKAFSCDIALLPLGQTYTMNSVAEAAEAALDTGAKIAIPIHYGTYEGTVEDAYTFKELLKDKIRVVIQAKTR